jgi:cytochrome c peroxidase
MSARRSIRRAVALLAPTLLWCAGAYASPQSAASLRSYLRPSEVPAPADNVPNAARIELGKALFFDPRLSGSNWISCATCHNPALGWSDALPAGIGHMGKQLGRATPTILNTAYLPVLMWDGRKATLEDQALGPVESADEMHQDPNVLVTKLASIAGYRSMFERAYPGSEISKDTISKAIASFERTIVSGAAPFDRWAQGQNDAISPSAKRGFELFTNQANCVACHAGFNFTDGSFHNIGVTDLAVVDAGRFAIKPLKSMRGAFKTPTLRDVALTAPYMRNGIYRTLDEVIEHYDRGGDVRENISAEIRPLNLSAQDKRDLVEFMLTLTANSAPLQLPVLPPGVTADIPKTPHLAGR